jgi:hypothetical protein
MTPYAVKRLNAIQESVKASNNNISKLNTLFIHLESKWLDRKTEHRNESLMKARSDCCAVAAKIRGAVNACLDLFVTFCGNAKK